MCCVVLLMTVTLWIKGVVFFDLLLIRLYSPFFLSFHSLCYLYSAKLIHLLNLDRLISPLLYFPLHPPLSLTSLQISPLYFLFLLSFLLFFSLYFSSLHLFFTSLLFHIFLLFSSLQAKDSGILRGDVLVNVDGTDTKGLSPEEVAAIIRCISLLTILH